jgi:hypothetical protein
MMFQRREAKIEKAALRLADSRVALAHAERDLLEAQSSVRDYQNEVLMMEKEMRKATND